MTREEAVRIIEDQREALAIDPDMEVEQAEKMIVEYKKDPDKPGPTEDRVAWVVTYCYAGGFVEVHVDDRRGEVLRVRRSA